MNQLLIPGKKAVIVISFLLASLLIRAQSPYNQFRTVDSINRAHLFTPLKTSNFGRPTTGALAGNQSSKQQLTNVAKLTKQAAFTSSAATLATAATVCLDTSGRYFVQDDTMYYYVSSSILAADGNILIAGECLNTTTFDVDRGFLMKCTDSGTVIWTKYYDSLDNKENSFINYYRILELNDGSIMMVGGTNNPVTKNVDQIITRVNNSGNVIWSKVYKSRLWQPGGSGSADYFYIMELKQDPMSGDVFFNSPHWSHGYNITRLRTTDGTIVWSNYYQSYSSTSFDRPFGLEINNNHLVSFSCFIGQMIGTFISIYTIDKNTGNPITTKYFQTDDPSNFNLGFLLPHDVTKLDNGNYAISGAMYKYYYWPSNNGIDLFHAGVAEFDPAGNFVQAYCFRNSHESNLYNTKITLFKDGSGVFSMLKLYSGYISDIYYVQFKNGQITNQRRRYYLNEGTPLENAAIRLGDGSDLIVKMLGDSVANKSRIEFLNLNATDTGSACLGFKDFSTYTERFGYIPFQYGLDSIGYNDLQEGTNKTITAVNGAPYWLPACRQISYCDSIDLVIANDAVCFGTQLNVIVRKNLSCGALPTFDYDASIVQFIRQVNDSVFLFDCKKPGSTKIYGHIMGCSIMTDSIEIAILNSKGKVSLGNDTIICPGNTIILKAGGGYASYEWQDGSVDSLLTITSVGTYHVKAVDSCGNVFRDTIIVQPHPPIAFDAGGDIDICRNDTTMIIAPSGFINYQWSPKYNITDTTQRVVKISPFSDTSYYIAAEKTPGCFVYDTVKVFVGTAPDIHLGADKEFCRGDSTILDVGPGFSNYSWNTGANGQLLTVHDKGEYIIVATSANGCKSKDTVEVLNVYSIPSPELGTNQVICQGTTRTLDAGIYAQYAWSTGSTNKTININTTGVYTVEVTDNHNCKGNDTLVINRMVAAPAKFLPNDTAICNFATITISPANNYASYLWSNNSYSSSITVSTAGEYILTVSDQYNCTGTDTMYLTINECLKGIYVPNAFVPGKPASKNARFKPMIFGNLVKYELMIFNRWGQQIFRTNDYSQSWDGTYKGLPQDTGSFIWLCRYQLADEILKEERGSVILIR